MRAVDEPTLLAEICRIVCDEAGYRMAWVGYAERDADKTVRPIARAGEEDGYLDRAAVSWGDTAARAWPVRHRDPQRRAFLGAGLRHRRASRAVASRGAGARLSRRRRPAAQR